MLYYVVLYYTIIISYSITRYFFLDVCVELGRWHSRDAGSLVFSNSTIQMLYKKLEPFSAFPSTPPHPRAKR